MKKHMILFGFLAVLTLGVSFQSSCNGGNGDDNGGHPTPSVMPANLDFGSLSADALEDVSEKADQ